MEALARNHRAMVNATVLMLVVMLAIIVVGMVLFPLSAYDDPSAGLIRGLINTPQGNIMVIAMFGVLSVNIAVFLSTITRLERERNTLLATNAEAQARNPEVVEGLKASGELEPPPPDSIYRPTK